MICLGYTSDLVKVWDNESDLLKNAQKVEAGHIEQKLWIEGPQSQ